MILITCRWLLGVPGDTPVDVREQDDGRRVHDGQLQVSAADVHVATLSPGQQHRTDQNPALPLPRISTRRAVAGGDAGENDAAERLRLLSWQPWERRRCGLGVLHQTSTFNALVVNEPEPHCKKCRCIHSFMLGLVLFHTWRRGTGKRAGGTAVKHAMWAPN